MKKNLFLLIAIFSISILSVNSHSFNLKLGAMYPTMNSDLWEINLENLAFQKQDMMGGYFGAEVELFLKRYISLSLEFGHYQQDVDTFYRDYEYDDGSGIYQYLSLNITSFELGFKVYPGGLKGSFLPYLGIGAGLYAWKYIQEGEFINFEEDTVFDGYADTSRLTPGLNAKLGFIYRFSRTWGISWEGRYHYIKSSLSALFEGFEQFDLSGWTFNLGVNIFF